MKLKRIRVWPHMIFLFLGVNMVICAITVVAALSDPSFAVEPDYYRKAVNWDQTARQRAESAELGWKVHVAPIPTGAGVGLRVIAADADAAPIEGAKVTATVFHSLRAKAAEHTTFAASVAGAYDAPLPMQRPGEWNVRLRIEHSGSVFVETLVVNAPPVLFAGGPK